MGGNDNPNGVCDKSAPFNAPHRLVSDAKLFRFNSTWLYAAAVFSMPVFNVFIEIYVDRQNFS